MTLGSLLKELVVKMDQGVMRNVTLNYEVSQMNCEENQKNSRYITSHRFLSSSSKSNQKDIRLYTKMILVV